jgi:hypothetical protein
MASNEKPKSPRVRRTGEHFHYLSAFDPGHAALLWPQKDPATARRRRRQHTSEIESTLKFNLLWRPCILIRHIDLFDNLAFARVIMSSVGERLSEEKLLKVSAPRVAPFQDLFEHWAIGSGAGQHFHHLPREAQGAFNRASRAGSVTLSKLQNFINLEAHSLDLKKLLETYDRLFHETGLLVEAQGHVPPEFYPRAVLIRLEQYLSDKSGVNPGAMRHLQPLEQIIRNGIKEGWRRREYYTQLEAKQYPHRLVDEIKVMVVNSAFYDEFEQLHIGDSKTAGQISAVRDFRSKRSLPSVDVLHRPPVERTPLTKVGPLKQLSIDDVISFHKGTNSEAKAFQASVLRLHRLETRRRGNISNTEIQAAVSQHIEIVNACVDSRFRDRRLPPPTKDAWSEVYLGYTPETVGALGAEAATRGFLQIAQHYHIDLPPSVVWFLNQLFVVYLTKPFARPTSAHEWHEFSQLVLTPTIIDEIVGE